MFLVLLLQKNTKNLATGVLLFCLFDISTPQASGEAYTGTVELNLLESAFNILLAGSVLKPPFKEKNNFVEDINCYLVIT